MAAAVFLLTANHTLRSVSLNAGSYTVLAQGTSFGAPVRKPLFAQVFDAQRISVAGAPVEAREQQLRVEVSGASMVALQANLDTLLRVCDDLSRRGGGTLAHTSTGGSVATTYRVAFAQVGQLENMGTEYEVSFRAVVTVALVVDPYGLGVESTTVTATGVELPRVIDAPATTGSIDALAGVRYTATSGVPTVMLYAWWPQLAIHNYVWNGGAETIGTTATVAYGWAATAVAGVIGAATSVTRTTTAATFRSGVAALEVITPATTDTGASFLIHRRGGFRAGVTYTARCYVRSAAGTTPVYVKLGISGSLGTGTASALTTSFAIRTVTWTPAADSDVAYFAVGVNAATATTFHVDDVQVFEGTVAPTCELGGHGPGPILSNAYNAAKASISSDGAYWTGAADATYLGGYRLRGAGAMGATANVEYPILPHLFEPDDYTSDEVDVAVFARLEVASTQTSLACAISVASDRGTGYGARRYGSFRSGGKSLTLPSSGTSFKPYFLGVVTLKVDRTKPRREWLRLSFTNSGAATGNFGIDYLMVVPVRSCARSRSGSSASLVPLFLTTAGTTKLIRSDLSGAVIEADGVAETPDDGLGGEPIRLPVDGCELLVWPSDHVVDLTTSDTTSMAKTFTGTVTVAVTPRVHLLKQA